MSTSTTTAVPASFRGVSAGGSEQMGVPSSKSWIEPIKDQHIVAVTGTEFRPTLQPGGTDSTAFSWIGLNGIGFQQDGLEYGTRTPPLERPTSTTASRRTM